MDDFENRDEGPHVPVRTVLISVAVLWAFYYLLVTLRGAVLGMDHQIEMLLPRLLVSIAGALVTLGLWLLMRPFDLRPLGVRIAVALIAALPGSILIAQVNSWAFSSLDARMAREMGSEGSVRIRRDDAGNVLVDIPGYPVMPVIKPGKDGDPLPKTHVIKVEDKTKDGMGGWREITDVAFARYFLLVAWAALYLALLAGVRARSAERREGEFRRAAKAAELRSLRYQVNPHFLFNTLNSLSALVLTGKTERAEEMIQTISTFYRSTLGEDPTADVTLAEEFEKQQLYLRIEAVRFPNRLIAEFDLPAHLAHLTVPGMIIQPLVENSVKYAVAPSTRPVHVWIRARLEDGTLVITVSDDGRIEEGKSKPESGYGIGLTNVGQRLRARYGEMARVVSGRTKDGFKTIITIPLAVEDERE
jgi:hypothetical protein